MKVAIPQPLQPQAMIPQLSAMLPGYKLYMRGGKILVAEKSAAVGATLFFRKDKVVVNGNFPNMGVQLLFVFALIFLGILIPLIIYFVTVYKSQKASEQEVGAALQALISGAQQGYPQQGYPQQGYPQQHMHM
jgi:uncharacterized membrane protein